MTAPLLSDDSRLAANTRVRLPKSGIHGLGAGIHELGTLI